MTASPRHRPSVADSLALVRAAVTRGGVDVLRGLTPIALGVRPSPGVDVDDPATWGDDAVTLGVVVHPLLAAVFDVAGGTRRGERTWSFSLVGTTDPTGLAAALDACRPHLVVTQAIATACESGGYPYHARGDRDRVADQVRTLLRTTTVSSDAFDASSLDAGLDTELAHPWPWDTNPAEGCAAIVVHIAASTLYLKVAATSLSNFVQGKHYSFDQLRLASRADELTVAPAVALDLVTLLERRGVPAVDTSGTGTMAEFRRHLDTAVLVATSPGRPAKGDVLVGPGLHGDPDRAGVFARFEDLTPGDVADHLAYAGGAGTTVRVDDRLADMLTLTDTVGTHLPDPVLRDYQAEAAALLVTTRYGMVNGCAPGLGKTVMTLRAWKHKADTAAGEGRAWRGIIAAKAALRTQWANETATFFPDATVRVLRSSADVRDFCDEWAASTSATTGAADEMAGPDDTPVDDSAYGPMFSLAFEADLPEPVATCTVDDHDAAVPPLVVVASYEVIARNVDALAAIGWDDVCVDEALVLKNRRAKRTQALWHLRDAAGVAVALTGTPIDRSLDDLGELVAWSRGDRDLFATQPLSRNFWAVATCEDTRNDFAAAIGPALFRRDRSEVADELPEVTTEVVMLEPTAAEKRLADAARRGLRAIYDDLAAKLAARQALDDGDPALAEAAEELASARGAVLGGVTLARMAASDPEALVTSESAGAALLAVDGLIDAAVAGGSTKRTQVAELTAELVAAGEAVLIFSDFTRVVDLLVAELRDHGLAVGRVVGGQSHTERDAAVGGFQDGTLDVLVSSSAGDEGLNLQRASVLVHYDLPWNPSAVIQRVGRAARLGSDHDRLQVLVPIMADTIESRVASVLVPRAATALAALDGTRGKDASATEIGVALGGLVDAVDVDEVGESMLDLARAVLGD